MLVLAKADIDAEGILPRIQADGSLRILFNCNDLFYWATADAEEYVDGDQNLLDSCLEDLQKADKHGDGYLLELFCCRKRGMRPQYPFFRKYDRERRGYFEDTLPPAIRVLFDALGLDGSDRNRG